MKHEAILSVFLLVSLLFYCTAEPCYDVQNMMDMKTEFERDCKSAVNKGTNQREKIKIGLNCCFTKYGVLDGDKIVFDKLQALAKKGVVPDKVSVITDGYEKCKSKFDVLANIKDGFSCVVDNIADKCSDIKMFADAIKKELKKL